MIVLILGTTLFASNSYSEVLRQRNNLPTVLAATLHLGGGNFCMINTVEKPYLLPPSLAAVEVGDLNFDTVKKAQEMINSMMSQYPLCTQAQEQMLERFSMDAEQTVFAEEIIFLHGKYLKKHIRTEKAKLLTRYGIGGCLALGVVGPYLISNIMFPSEAVAPPLANRLLSKIIATPMKIAIIFWIIRIPLISTATISLSALVCNVATEELFIY